MNHNRLRFCLLALVLSGCVVVGTAGKPAAKQKPKSPALNIGITGSAGQIFQPDPKLPGKYLWKMYVKSASGMSEDNGFAGTLTGVTAVLYQNGVANAVMTAPRASGNSTSQVIVATGPGRIKVRSLTEEGTTLEADKMTWYARSNKIVAVGNVDYQKGKGGAVVHVPRDPVNADTKIKSIMFGRGTTMLR